MNGKLFIKAIFLALLLLPCVNAVTITDTTFSTSISNYTIHVDSITLDNVTVTSTTIEFYNLISLGSNLTNTNDTYNSRADFYGLQTGLIVHNVNTSTDLFISSTGNQNYNAIFTPGQVLRITNDPVYSCTSADRTLLNLTTLFFSILIMALPLGLLIHNGKLSLETDIKIILIIFIGIILGAIFIREIANEVFAFCG